MASPYQGIDASKWQETTRHLIAAHPLSPTEILEIVQIAWARVWQTRVGDVAGGFALAEIEPPATVVGAFFERLFAKELATRYPDKWTLGKGSQKDLHHLPDDSFSIELKTSGQPGFSIYGNRSYGQELENEAAKKKDKSGYYITINFFGQTLTLVRFGWIDASDWVSQRASTGQMAGLGADVYKHKLVAIPGPYQLAAPARLLKGVGEKLMKELQELKIQTVLDLLRHQGELRGRLQALQKDARDYYKDLYQ
ncbi:ScaI family restriction endonuclease [Pseudoxanthomonas sp. SL93]|uniref:ScaI family restriction endonuclease n=1 Tax=Pseudoxanthomonas sp. SL93 TaxID=2995142 RepID=UPI00226E33F8|nr:ScaI family restriction endonuclease [Pseudoxanthomonas sp. SL93]WAC62076.1 ScaI family restriction endonuclease [Pseudoxanthomonas sp. SL93]